MAAISTILLIANLAAWILRGIPLFSFWWNALAYGIEIAICLIIFTIFVMIVNRS